MNWNPLFLSFQLAAATTAILLLIAIPLAYFLSKKNSILSTVTETVLSLSMVLPPTVMGFYFLMIFSPNSPIGKFFHSLGLPMVFSFSGLLAVSVIYNLSQMLNPLKSGFESIPQKYTDAAISLGKSRTAILFRVFLPNMKPAIFTGIVLSFAHTLGAFGIILMVGGSIPGETRVASVAIYHYMDSLNYSAAHVYSGLLLLIAFILLLGVNLFKRKGRKGELC